jgi:two-component system response regulator PilR (NtrC family)
MEGDLFGYAPGGFAGAPGAEQGYFKAAEGGTLLLADIGAMPPTCQARVATALRDEAVVPLGSYSPSPIDVRFIATSDEDLEARVAGRGFREDLLCKLNVLGIYLVPLRQRRADLPLMFEYFSRRIAQSTPPKISPRAWDAICAYPFPGNVDEIQDAIKHALARARGSVIDIEHLPTAIVSARPRPGGGPARTSSGTRLKAGTVSSEWDDSASAPEHDGARSRRRLP